MAKQIKPGSTAKRALHFDATTADDATRSLSLAFASEAPYDRGWGVEVLNVSKESIRLGRLHAGAPLLIDHENSIRSQVGVVESVEIGADRVGRATVRFGKTALADEVFQQVRDGIVRNVSFGYLIHDAKAEGKDERGVEVFRVTDFEPLEISIVAVPADYQGAGIGRAFVADDATPIELIETPDIKEKVMPEITVEESRAAGAQDAHKRAADMLAIGKQYKCVDLAADMIAAGKNADDLKSAIIERMANKPLDTADIGMTGKEAQRFSFLRAINALANPTDRRAQEVAGFERECSEAVGQKLGRSAQGFFVPNDVQKRDLVVGTAGAGGYTVSTDLLAANFIDMLRNRMMVMKMGAQMLSGLTGQIAIPRQTGGATAYWVAESGAVTESTQAFDQVTMTPRTVGAFNDISRKLLLQSSIDIEAFVRNDLAKVLGLAIDLAAIHGTGASNQPTGIVSTAGIGSVVGGTNGLAPTWAHIVELWSDVATANADFGSTGFLTNSKVVGKLMTTEKASSTAQFVCPGFPDASGMTTFGGGKAGVSNQVSSALTKGSSSGVCSAILFGNFADLIIGSWGTLDLIVDPYTASTSGTVRVVALQDVDIAVRHAESFSAMLDALTA